MKRRIIPEEEIISIYKEHQKWLASSGKNGEKDKVPTSDVISRLTEHLQKFK